MSYFVTDENLSMCYQYYGKSTQPRIVLIAGLARDQQIWNELLPLLTPHYTILCFDNRDVGKTASANKPYGIETMANDTRQLLEHLAFFPATIIGHSMGGFIAFHLANQAPHLIHQLIICNAGSHQSEKGKAYLAQRVQWAEDEQLSPALRMQRIIPWLYGQTYLSQPGRLQMLLQTKCYAQSKNQFIRQANACLHYDIRPHLHNITQPTLILTGEEDIRVTPAIASQLADRLPHAKTHTLPNIGHVTPLEAPASLANIIMQALPNEAS